MRSAVIISSNIYVVRQLWLSIRTVRRSELSIRYLFDDVEMLGESNICIFYNNNAVLFSKLVEIEGNISK